MKITTQIFTGVLLCLLISPTLYAQEFRLFTKVYDYSDATQNPVVIARSLSLFHAGKVYDFVDTVGEVIIFEPVKNRFIILNTKRDLVTTANLDEIKHHLKVARKVTLEHIQTLQKSIKDDPDDPIDKKRMNQVASREQIVEQLMFQLDPTFKIDFDSSTKRLRLSGTGITYLTTGTKHNSQEVIDAFLKYVDWTARLNYVLHPGLVSPDSRIVLNEQLREQKLLPTEVELKVSGRHLRAVHQFHWNLDSRDRNLIHRWTTQLKSKTIKKVTLQAYQRLVIAGHKG